MVLICEHCNSEIESVVSAHSMLVVLQKVSAAGYAYFQCEQGREHGGLSFQHWHCSHDEMKAGVTDCISKHYRESDLIAVPTSQVRLHRLVLAAGLRCKVCNQALTSQAYRFCLTHATPVNTIPDNSHEELGEWCCSLDHAQQSALAILTAQ